MKVTIDTKICTGHGLCYVDAPTAFADDDHGYGQVLGDGTVAGSDAESARHAVANCRKARSHLRSER